MRVISATKAREQLYRLIDEVSRDSEPVYITGPRSGAVLVSAEDWRSMEETLYLQSIPGMVESIKDASNAPDEEFADKLDW
jgi:prevent-host-death family protein